MNYRPFTTLLVANRGEIARRVMRTARAMGLRTVAVYVDADVGQPFVDDADDGVRIASYLDADSIVAAATATGAEAVHPGYGFLSEQGSFAAAVIDAGLVWVGPTPASIAAMGDKIAAKQLARDHEVPILPSTDDVSEMAGVGFPLMIKAAAGGGGKGMRIVSSAGDLDDALAAAGREAQSSFGDGRLFAERYVRRARHVEIQVLGDSHGTVIHLGERECSIQRRHQKIIEEAPSPWLGAHRRATLGADAVRLAAALRYVSAGTVEFLVDDESGDHFFLEVNTRLQVEHPVTEEVTGVDLVREQLRVAMGEAVGLAQDDVVWSGHAVEARLYAEDPAEEFLPATGTLDAFEPAPEPAVRWDVGVRSGSEIGVEFDPMIAKVVASAPTRGEAAGRLALALDRLHIGGVTTNRDFLSAVLRTPEFLAGDTTTDFIERVRPPARRHVPDDELGRLAAAAAMWLQAANRAEVGVMATIPSGFRVGRIPAERVVMSHGDETLTVHYRRRRDGAFVLGAAGDRGLARVVSCSPSHVDVEVDGRRRRLRVTRAGDRLHLTGTGGGVTFDLVARFSPPVVDLPGGSVVAPMPGQILEVRVHPGDQVKVGQVVVVLEAMKMEHHLRAPEAGTVTSVGTIAGEQVDKGVVLLTIEAGDVPEGQDGPT